MGDRLKDGEMVGLKALSTYDDQWRLEVVGIRLHEPLTLAAPLFIEGSLLREVQLW